MAGPLPRRTTHISRPDWLPRRAWLTVPLLVIVSLALGACSGMSGTTAGGKSSDTIVFGAPISLTGSLAKEGTLTRDGYEIWKDTYNSAVGIKVGGKQYKNPDFFLKSGPLQESLATMQQSKEFGFNPKGYAFSVGPSTPDFQTSLKSDADYVFGGTQWMPFLTYQGEDLFKSPDAYNKQYQEKFKYEPAYQRAESIACGIAFAKALEVAGSLDPKGVRDALAKLDFMSFYGQIKFDERGINTFKPMAVEQRQDGKKVTAWPAEVANARPIWPTPAWTSR